MYERKRKPAWVELPSAHIKWLNECAEVLHAEHRTTLANTIEGASHEIQALQAHRESLMHAHEHCNDTTLVCKALIKGKARWEAFHNMHAQGEVCVGGLRYATTLYDGVPVVNDVIRNALKRALGMTD